MLRRTGVGVGGELVVLAAVDLHLVVVEAMDQVARDGGAASIAVPVLKKPAGSSMRNILLGMPTVCACVITVVCPPAVDAPPQTGGSAGSTEPSKSFCGSTLPVDEVGLTPGMPLAPG